MRPVAAYLVLVLVLAPVANVQAANYTGLAAGVLALYSRPKPNPAPTPPQPGPSDVCDNCGGTGRLGDGTVFVTCPVCDGTGKRKAAYLPCVCDQGGGSCSRDGQAGCPGGDQCQCDPYQATPAKPKQPTPAKETAWHWETRCSGGSCRQVRVQTAPPKTQTKPEEPSGAVQRPRLRMRMFRR